MTGRGAEAVTTPPVAPRAQSGYRGGWSGPRLSSAVAANRDGYLGATDEQARPDEIEFFATNGRRRDLPRGVLLAQRGTTTAEVHLVDRGALALFGQHDGRRPIVAFAVCAEFCGPVSALLHEATPWDAVTVIDSSVITVPAAEFMAAVRDRWVDRWATRVLTWLTEVGARIADIDGRDLEAQVATLLLRNPHGFPVDGCRRTISDLLDVDMVTTRRVVDDLERLGALRITGGRIWVVRPQVLRKLTAVGRSAAGRNGTKAVVRRCSRSVAATA